MFKKLLIAVALTFALAVSAAAAFSDVPASHWAAADVEKVSAAGVILGYPDGGFHPEKTLTRAEITAMCVRAILGEQPAAADGESWYAPYFAAAAQWELPFGEDADLNAPVTRGEIAKLLVSTDALKVAHYAYGAESRAIARSLRFSDIVYENADYEQYLTRCAVTTAVDTGLLGGYPDGTFRPEKALRRCEAAAVLSRLLLNKSIADTGGHLIATDGKFIIYYTVAEDGGAAITSCRTEDGMTLSSCTVAGDIPEDGKIDGVDPAPEHYWDKVLIKGNSRYFWGEFGFYEYAADGTFRQISARPAIDYGYDSADGSIVFISHEDGERCCYSGGGLLNRCGDMVVRAYPDGTEKILLTKDTLDEVYDPDSMMRPNLSRVEYATGGKVRVVSSIVWGMADTHSYLYEIADGKMNLLQMGAGNGYSY